MIRIAQVTDWKGVATLLRLFRNDPVTPPWLAGEGENPHAERFLVGMLDQKYSFIAIEKDEIVGMLLSLKSLVPFTNNVIIEEMAWYVRKDYRHTKIGYQLLKSWEAMIDDLKHSGMIMGGVIHTMADSPVNLSNHGYNKSDTTYMR